LIAAQPVSQANISLSEPKDFTGLETATEVKGESKFKVIDFLHHEIDIKNGRPNEISMLSGIEVVALACGEDHVLAQVACIKCKVCGILLRITSDCNRTRVVLS
jgi:hypothetical protein